MATMSIRVEDSLHRRIEEAAEGDGLSVSQWARTAIMSALGLDSGEAGRWSAPTTLSKGDRQQLALLHQLAELTSTEEYDKKHHATMVEVLQQGFTSEYAEEFTAIDEEMPIAECELVRDLLSMFRAIKVSVAQIGIDKIRETGIEEPLTFSGFDFNHPRETRMAIYAKHMIKTGRWTDLAEHFEPENEGGNSHSQVLDSYLRMLDVFNQALTNRVEGRYYLDETDLANIANARWYIHQR